MKLAFFSLGLGLLLVWAWAWAAAYPALAPLLWLRGTGLVAASVFVGSLLWSPLIRLGHPARLGAERRRAFGLAAAAAALLHGGIAVATPWVPGWRLLILEPVLRAGLGAAVLLLILAATSFPRRWVPRHWKALHRSVWGVGALLVLHVALSSHAGVVELGGLVIVLGLLALARAPGAHSASS